MPAALYLITPVLDAAAAFAAPLEAALEAAFVSSVLLRTAPGRDRHAIAAALMPLAQMHGAAALIDGDAEIAEEMDGVHVAGSLDRLTAAVRHHKPDRIVGAGGLATRDDAMLAGEAGADYLMFGDDGGAETLADRCERVAWWAEIFEIPCVAWAHRLDEVEALAAAGAEFIALEDAVWSDPRGPAAAVRDAAAMIDAASHRPVAEAG